MPSQEATLNRSCHPRDLVHHAPQRFPPTNLRTPPDHTKRPPTVRQSPLMAQYWRYTGLHDRGSHWALTLGARSTTEVSSRSAKMPFGEAMLLPTWHENLCVTHKYDYAPS
jgi:hypothetical protein